MKTRYRRRVSFVLYSLLSHFSSPAINIVLSVVVIRKYSSEFWGAYVEVVLLVSLLLTVVNWGSKDFLLKRYSELPAEIPRWLAASISAKALIGMLILLLCWPMLGGYKHWPLICIWVMVRMSWQFFEALNVYRRLYWQTALIDLVLVGAVITAVFLVDIDLSQFIHLLIVSDGIKATGYLLLNASRVSLQMDVPLIRRFLREAAPFFALALMGLVASRAELYMLGFRDDRVVLARYQILSNFVQYAHLFAAAVLSPFLKNLYRINQKAFTRFEHLFMLAGMPVSLVLTILIFAITKFLYQFHIAFPAFILVYFNIWGFYFYFMRIQANFRENKLFQTIFIISVMGLTNVVLGFILIPEIGLIGALCANLGAMLVGIAGFRARL